MTSTVAAPYRGPAETIEQPQTAAVSGRTGQSLLFALPKGRLAQDSLNFLEQAGLSIPTDTESRKLILPAADGSTGFVMAKPRDVPTYVEYGAADLGICGLDVVRETDRSVYEPLLLPFGHCRLSVAGPEYGEAVPFEKGLEVADLAVEPASSSNLPGIPLRYMSQPRIATEYPRLTRQFFADRGVNAEIIALGGSVELGPILGLADLIVDVVQTGTTLRMNGLVEIRTILESQAVLVVNRASYQLKAAEIYRIIERMRLLTA